MSNQLFLFFISHLCFFKEMAKPRLGAMFKWQPGTVCVHAWVCVCVRVLVLVLVHVCDHSFISHIERGFRPSANG